MRIKITQCLEDGARLYTSNYKKLVLASLIAVYLMIVSGSLFTGAVIVGMLMLIDAFDKGENVENGIACIFKGFKYFLQTLVICLSVGVVVLAVVAICHLIGLKAGLTGLFGLIIAFAMGICLMYSFFFIYEEDMNVIDAAKSSFSLVKKDVLGSAIILVLTKIIAGCCLIFHGMEKGEGGMVVIGIVVMVFMLPLVLSVYYKAYKMLKASVDGENLKAKNEEADLAMVAEKAESENKVKKEETVEEAVVEPEVIPPANDDDDEDDVLGV